MNIAFSANRTFMRYLPVVLASLRANHADGEFEIFLLDADLTEADRRELDGYAGQFGMGLTFLRVDKTFFDGFPLAESDHVSIETYFRLALPSLLPSDMDRILYLDIDIVVDGDLSELYNTPFNGHYLVAASHKPDYHLNPVPLAGVTPLHGGYFNAGVLLLNLPLFRERIRFEDYIEVAQNKDLQWHDQGILNYLFWDKTIYIPTLKYNFRPFWADRVSEHPVIIHYATIYKPWDLYFEDDANRIPEYSSTPFPITKEYNNLQGIWWRYAQQCPELYDELYKEMLIKKEFFLRSSARTMKYVNRMERYHNAYEKLYQPDIENKVIDKLRNFAPVAIYGWGKLGQSFTCRIQNYGVQVRAVVDRMFSSPHNEGDVLFTAVLSGTEDIGAVIVTPLVDGDAIAARLAQCTAAKIFTVDELLNSL